MQISVFMNLGILVLQNFIFGPNFCPICDTEVLVLYKQMYWIFWITVCEKCWQTSCPSYLKTSGQMMHCFWLHWGGWYLNGPKICPVCDIGFVNVSIRKKIPHRCNFWFWITPRGGGGGGAHIWQWNHYKIILYWAINVKKNMSRLWPPSVTIRKIDLFLDNLLRTCSCNRGTQVDIAIFTKNDFFRF